MRKILYICSLIIIFAMTTYAQSTTVTIGQVSASIGEQISVPITVTNFFNIGAITLKIQCDPAVLTLDDIINEPSGTSFNAALSNGVISISWASLSAINITNGKLADLKITYKGGTSNLNFVTNQCEIANASGIVIPGIVYNNGKIESNPVEAVKVQLGNITGSIGEIVAVPVTVANFDNVGAVTLKIQYDPSVVEFDSVSRKTEFQAGANGGVISISRAALTAVTPTDGKLLDIYLKIKGGTSTLVFNLSQCEIATTAGVVIPGVQYVDGEVGANINDAVKVELGSVTGSLNGVVGVPINVANFDNVGAVTLKIQYDPTVIKFDSVSRASEFQAGASNGIVSISRASLSAVIPTDGKLLDVYFTYNGGTSALSFNTVQCEIATTGGTVIPGVQYTDGQVSGNPEDQISVTLDSVTGNLNESVAVPLSVANFDNIGAITLKIQYDPSVAKFDSVSRSSEFQAGANGGILSISRASLTAVIPTDGKLLVVYFTYKGGTTPLTFNVANCEIATTTGTVIPGIQYNNGEISPNQEQIVTVTLDDVTGTVNQSVAVPLNVTNFDNIGAVTLKIQYNPAVAKFDSISRSSEFQSGVNGGVLSISRAALTAVIPTDGKLLDVYFTYLGGNSDLSFNKAQCEIATTTGNVIPGVSYVDGSISAGVNTLPTFELPNLVETNGNEISVPVTIKRLEDVGAITLKIQYDQLALTYRGITNNNFTVFGAANNGIISLSWASLAGITSDSTALVNINFTFHGGTSPLTFVTDQCEVAKADGSVITFVQYINGSVSGNQAPAFTTEMPDTTIPEGEAFEFQFAAADPNGTALEYSVDGPEGSSIDSLTGLFSWTPGFDQAGTYTVKVAISDGVLTDTTESSITVTNTNRAPLFTKELKDTTINRGDKFTFQYEATDPDGDALTYKLLKGPSGLVVSTNGKLEWTPPTTASINDLEVEVSDGVLSDTSVIKLTVYVKNVGSDKPTVYQLSQNYPNPFNPSTKIKYAIPEESKVVLKVYNLLGQEVQTLVNEVQSAAFYAVDFNASNLPSGIYLYKVEANNFREVKKMILLK